MSTKDLQFPTKEIDLDLLVFIERYANTHLKWDLLVYFAANPDSPVSVQDMAVIIGRSYRVIRPEVGDLVLAGILIKLNSTATPLYQLTTVPTLRTQVLKFAPQKPSAS